MDIRKGFSDFDMDHPGRSREIKRISVALCRSGISTMEKLSEIYRLIPDQLLTVRDIGQGRMDLIGEILRHYETKAMPEGR